jgi:Rod binding domain-containing protein
MKKTIPESGFLKEGFAHRIYEEEFYTLLAEKLAEEGGIGLAKILYQELKNKMKENSGGQNGGNKRVNQGFKKTASSL